MTSRRTLLLFLLVLVARLLTQNWDSGLLTPHPDERQVANMVEDLEGWFDDPQFYAYGSLHFQAVRAVAAVMPLESDYHSLLRGGRLLSMIAVLVAAVIGWAMARRAWGRRTADLFLLLLAFVPLDIQLSHYATVEAHHAFWVVTALGGCFWLARTGTVPAAAVAGAAIGASLAVKVSSLALLAPLAVAVLVFALEWRRPARPIALAATAVAAGAVAFWLAQPSAFEGGWPTGFNPEYLRGVGEQVAMVAGTSDVVYVRVYHGTLPVLYSLRELALWGLGPLLLLAAAVSAIRGAWWLLKRWHRWLEGRLSDGAVLLMVLLAWLLPMAARLSTLQVKFLRYWEPLVVPAVLVAAWGLTRLPKRWRRTAVTVVVAGTVLWGLSYLWAFVEPHPHRTAAEWLRAMVDRDQIVAFEHWDEGLDLPGAVRVDMTSYELPDDDDKVRQIVQALSEADWLVMTSNRVRRTVLVNRHRYPLTGRLYRLLLAGEAGFEPLTAAARGPRFFGLERRVQRADESFVNYDFPRVVVLRRVAKVPVDELVARLSRPLPYLEELDADGVDEAFIDTLPRIPASPSAARQVFDLVLWMVVFALLTGATWSLLLPVLRGWPDAGVGLALVTGWIVPSWLLWLGSELAVWRVGPVTVTWLLLALVGAGVLAFWRRRRLAQRLLRQRRREIVIVLGVAAVVLLLFLVARLVNPAVFWGEKPMDFAFLNAFLRADSWPPDEPWMAGMPLHYYYFGQVLASFPILVAGCSSAVGYNLMSATVPALAAAPLAALGLALLRRRRWAAAWIVPLLVLLTGNLAWLWPNMLELARGGRWFDLWWATSRVLEQPAIDEFPLWTALFADLHGHFIALPVMVASLLWGWAAVRLRRNWWLAAALCGITAAVLVATNPWDVFLLTGALGIGCLVAAPRPLRALSRLVFAGLASVAAGLPFITELVTGIGAGAGGRFFHLTAGEFASAISLARHFGVFLVPLLVLALTLLWQRSAWIFVVPLATAAALGGIAFDSGAAALALAAAVLLAAVAVGTGDRLQRLAWSLAALGMMTVAVCERFTLIDRMNTIFKLYNGVWLLLAVALGVLLLRSSGFGRSVLVANWLPLQLVAMLNLPLGVGQAAHSPRLPHPGSTAPRPTLDGQAFLATQDPQTWFLARALQAVARPGEPVAEAYRLPYAQSTRIAMHTGQPTVAGWPHHLKQRGQSEFEMEARYADLRRLYSESLPAERRRVVDRYGVRWVVVADEERKTYGIVDDDPFLAVPGMIRLAASDDAALYMVRPLTAGATAAPITLHRPLPDSVQPVGQVPLVPAEVLRSLALSKAGGTAVLPNGTVRRFGLDGFLSADVAAPPCSVISAARRGDEEWLACVDGRLWRRSDDAWIDAGQLPFAGAAIVIGETLWAWGRDGLWRLSTDGRWRRVAEGTITAAAASGPVVAWSNGSAVFLETAKRRQVGEPLSSVRDLAWQGPVLWTLTELGLFRSGGGVLPWRRALPDLEGVVALSGTVDRLWLVLDEGVLVQDLAPPCASPWQRGSGEAGLLEPRGLAVSAEGWFAVADTQHHRLRWYTLGGVCLDAFGVEGDLPGEFLEPTGLALAVDGTLAVTDTWNGRVQLLRPDGVIQVLGTSLYGPRDLLWSADGALLASDTGNRRLLRFAPPDWRDDTLVEFSDPVVGLAWAQGLLAVAMPLAEEVVLLDPDDWQEVRRITVPGWVGGGQQEGYLLSLPSGELLASAPHRGELWLLDPSGTTAPRVFRKGLKGVTGMALLPDGQLLVSQTVEHRLSRLVIGEPISN